MIPIARRTLPGPIRSWLWSQWSGAIYTPPVGWVRFGNLRRISPVSSHFGFDRGLPIDRYYIKNFLEKHAGDIRGHVLEIGDDAYTQRFGAGRVTTSDVLHVEKGNPKATYIGDLTCADHLPSDAFDCFVLTQTLHLIYDIRAALRTIYRILKPGGVVLATFPGISQKSHDQWGDSWYWGFTCLSAGRLFEEVFPKASLQVESFGNVLSSIAFLQGLAVEELSPKELDYHDNKYEMLITVRAVKPQVKV